MDYTWLTKQINSIHTKKFHVVEGPISEDFRLTLEQHGASFPPSYRAFVTLFSNAQLYRAGDTYLVTVFAAPREIALSKRESWYCIGYRDESDVLLKPDDLSVDGEAPIYERRKNRITTVAPTFSKWLRKACGWAKRQYDALEWQAILAGPPPFSNRELNIIAARGQYEWSLVRVAPNGHLFFRVSNQSPLKLPYLSISIQSRDGTFSGGVWVPVGHIEPGESLLVEIEGYSPSLISPAEVVAVPLPNPEPEDRSRYWEFKIPT